jgi:hypothetical protein
MSPLRLEPALDGRLSGMGAGPVAASSPFGSCHPRAENPDCDSKSGTCNTHFFVKNKATK